MAHSVTSSATRQEQRTVTQEVKTTSTVVAGDQVNFYFLLFSFCFNFLTLATNPLKNHGSFSTGRGGDMLRHCTLTRMAYSWADETALARLVQVIQARQSIHRTIQIIRTIVATSIG